MATESAIAFVLDFYDGNGNEISERRIPAMTINDIKRITDISEQRGTRFFNELQDKLYFDNIKAMPGFLYDINEEPDRRWRFALNANKERGEYAGIPMTKYAPNEPTVVLTSYNFTQYFNYCIKNPNNNYTKHCSFTYKIDTIQVVIILSAINTQLIDETIPEQTKKILLDKHAAFKQQTFAQFHVNSNQYGA